MLQVERRLSVGEVVIDAVFECDADKGQAIERCRADGIDSRRGGKTDFQRDRVVALHLLGRLTGGLGGNLQDHGRRIRVGLDVEHRVSGKSAREKNQQEQQDNRAAAQGERQNGFQHGLPLLRLLIGTRSSGRCSRTARLRSRPSSPGCRPSTI